MSEVEFPCPFPDCVKVAKNKAGLASHTRTQHGVSLKQLEEASQEVVEVEVPVEEVKEEVVVAKPPAKVETKEEKIPLRKELEGQSAEILVTIFKRQRE